MNNPFVACALLGALLMPGMAAAQTCTGDDVSTPTSRFTFNSDGTVTDTQTGLMWKRCLEGQTFSDNGTSSNYLDDNCTGEVSTMSWKGALNLAQIADGWRIPNLKELKSIVEFCQASPAINQEVFPNAESGLVWASSPVNTAGSTSKSWTVHFGVGYDHWADRVNFAHIRMVRSAP